MCPRLSGQTVGSNERFKLIIIKQVNHSHIQNSKDNELAIPFILSKNVMGIVNNNWKQKFIQ